MLRQTHLSRVIALFDIRGAWKSIEHYPKPSSENKAKRHSQKDGCSYNYFYYTEKKLIDYWLPAWETDIEGAIWYSCHLYRGTENGFIVSADGFIPDASCDCSLFRVEYLIKWLHVTPSPNHFSLLIIQSVMHPSLISNTASCHFSERGRTNFWIIINEAHGRAILSFLKGSAHTLY